ncbi:MAG: PEP-CTERM sorting domain-containing protein [Planctomycetia bacterium]|nr:PEP-CTERM sorting domain-containing protein [Planctomycetia bacterium]
MKKFFRNGVVVGLLGVAVMALSTMVVGDDSTITYNGTTNTYSGYGTINTAKTFTADTFFDIAAGNTITASTATPVFSGETGITVTKTGSGTLNFNTYANLLGTFRILDGTVSLNSSNGGKGTIGQNCVIEISGTNSQLICNNGDTLGYNNNKENVTKITISDGARMIYMGNYHQTNCAETILSNGSIVMDPDTTMESSRYSWFANTITSRAGTINVIDTQNTNLRGSANFVVEADSLLSLKSDLVAGMGAALIKNGAGKMVVSGDNAYKTATNVNAGTLTFDTTASMGATRGITVAEGATLGFGANLFSLENGTFPTMTFGGNNGLEVRIVNIDNYTSLDWSDFNVVNPENIIALYVDMSDYEQTQHRESYNIITGLTGELQNLELVLTSLPTSLESMSLHYADGVYSLNLTGVPEPSTWLLLFLGVGMLPFLRRQK